MAIIQISKIQHRSGDLVDLPQLDQAEFGFASDENRLFIGKTTGNVENIEVLTSYSTIDFNQINGAIGNLDISNNVANGQVLAYDGNNWVNKGGNAGGLLTLGDVSNVKITGGAIGYVLETDGIGNLSWTPKSTITASILNVTQTTTGVVTTTDDNFFVNATEITITGVLQMTELNGNTYYAKILTANSFELYQESTLTTPVNTSGFTAFPYTTGTATSASGNIITVADSSVFGLNDPIIFLGDTDEANSQLVANTVYYVKSAPSGTEITVIETSGGATFAVGTATLSVQAYSPGGRVIAAVGGSGTTAAGGANTTIQYNNNNILEGDADFTFNFGASPKVMSLNGNANVGNLNANGVVQTTRFISNISTGTAPLTVSSTTRVANLNVEYANVADFINVNTVTTGTFYPVLANALSGNVVEGANANLSFNAATGNLIATLLTGTITTQTQPNITSLGNGTQITVVGNLNPSANITYNLGNATNRWNDIYLSGSTIYLGNATIESIPSGVLITNADGGTFLIGGNSAANSAALVNGTSNVVVSSNSNVTVSVAGNANILTVTGTGVNVAGTLNSTGNANVGNLGTAGLITAAGNVSGGNLTTAGRVVATGNITGGNLTTGGALSVTGNANVGNIGATNGIFTAISGGLLTSAQPNITSVGTLSSLTVTANIVSGNVFANSGTVRGSTLQGTTLTTGAAATAGTITGNWTLSSGSTINGLVSNATHACTANTVTNSTQSNITSVGTLTSLSVSGALTTRQITTGANTTTGNITGNWTLTAGSRLQATYADLAEYYSADDHYIVGTVLAFGGEKEVTLAGDETNKVAGVVSGEPAYVMNGNIRCDHPVIIALIGRVPVRVIGKVSKGDMLISAGNGFAKAAIMMPKVGTVIGKAISDKSDDGAGIIEVMVGRI